MELDLGELGLEGLGGTVGRLDDVPGDVSEEPEHLVGGRPAAVANGDGPEAALMRSLLDAFAQYERALIRARTRAALAVKKARGERTGGVPLGSSVGADGRLEANEAERAAIERARDLRAEGRSLREIAAVLDAEGHRPRGKRWHVQTLATVVVDHKSPADATAGR